MALNSGILQRLLAGALSVIEQARAGLQREADLRSENANLRNENDSLKEELGRAQEAEVADRAQDDADNKNLADTADALEKLIQGDETPEAPETPTPDEAPAVISGDAPVQGGEDVVAD